MDGVLWRSKIFLLTPDPNADPFCAKPPWSGESTTSGFCPFQSQKWPKSAVPQRMEKSTAAHNPEVGGSSPPPATIEKPSDCKALRPRSLGFLFALIGQKRDFSGTVPLICCSVGIKERPRYKPRPLLAIGLLVLSSAGQNNHNRQRQDKKDNHNARLLTSMVSLRLLSVKKIVQGVTCLFIALGKHMAINIQRG